LQKVTALGFLNCLEEPKGTHGEGLKHDADNPLA